MKKKLLLGLLPLLTLASCGGNPSGNNEDDQLVDIPEIKVMSANLDQGHSTNTIYQQKVLTDILSVNADLIGVQEEGDAWANFLKEELEEYGYQHIYTTRGGSFSEASGIFIKLDRFSIKESGTFWYGDNENAGSGYVANEWNATFPRVCTWAVLHDNYGNRDISYFNTHYEYNHPSGTMDSCKDYTYDGTVTTANTVAWRVNASKQVIKNMKAKEVPGIFTGDLNFWREKEAATYETLTEYFDDNWALCKDDANSMCSYHNYGRELNPETRYYDYSPIDYIFSTKGEFVPNYFKIISKEGTKEEDFSSDHFFVYASLSYKDAKRPAKPAEEVPAEHVCKHKCPDCGKCTDATCTDAKCADKCGGHAPVHECEHKCPTCGFCLDATCSDPICSAKCGGHEKPTGTGNNIIVMSVNLDQGHQNDSYYHNRVKKAIDSVNPDLFGVQEEGDGWVNALKPYYESKGYTHIYTTRGGSFSEASGIFIKNSRFEILDSGTFWFSSTASNQSRSGYIATEWGALYPRICSWAKLKDKTNNKELSYFNAHLEYNHAFGSSSNATSDNNTIYCRTSSIKQIIKKAKELNVPSIFTGDLNFFRTETQTYNQCLTYFDDVWALNKTLANDMCSFHDYGKELNPATRTNPYSPIDYIYTSKNDWVSSEFIIMSNEGTKELDFDSDHFFVHANIDYAKSL